MELHEKLQTLRKQKGLTQEELAEALYVSRAAISKWESGRGSPSLDSLQALAKFFSLTMDELLSGEELPARAEDRAKKVWPFRVFALLDCSAAAFLFLPVFGQTAGGAVQSVPLLALTETAPYLRGLYAALLLTMTVLGLLTLALGSLRLRKGSLLCNGLGTFLFILSSQPYAATALFLFLLVKAAVIRNVSPP